MYYPTMATLVHKKKKGRYYTYWVRTARVQGKPRIVEQVYLGPKERVLAEIRALYAGGHGETAPVLRRVQTREFGATALLWHWAERLGLSAIVDRHVSAPPPGRRTGLSVGQYLVIAALNRVVGGQSKRALYGHWYRDSVLGRLCPARPTELSSQRFWDHMDQVGPEAIERIQQDLLTRLAEVFPLAGETILYDTTNYYTFLDSFNARSTLAQRGANKQKRYDLRQLGLALFEDRETGLPLYHQTYAGNHNDATHLAAAWQGLLPAWLTGLGRDAEQLTLVFDRGPASARNFQGLEERPLHYVTGIPNGWTPKLLAVELEAYRPLALPGHRHTKVYRTRHLVAGRERTVVVVFSPTLYRKQRLTLGREQARAQARLEELAAALEAGGRSGHGEAAVRRKIQDWTRREHLAEFLDVELAVDGGKVQALRWTWNREKKRATQRRWLGKQILVTNRDDWDDAAIVAAYRRLTRTERLFRLSKSQPGVWWPMYHWTDSKIRVHALYCHFALLLLAILERELRRAGLPLRIDRALERLGRIEEALVVYASGASDRVLSQMDDEQRTIADAVGLSAIAAALGTTLPTAA